MAGTAPDDVLIGLNAKLYRNTGTYGSPTWVEVCLIGDLTLNIEKSEATISVRCSGWELIRAVLKKASVDFKMMYNPGNSSFQAIRDAFNNNTRIEFAVMDGDITAGATTLTQGLRATMEVMKFNIGQPLEGAQTVDVTLKPSYNSNLPSWYTVSA